MQISIGRHFYFYELCSIAGWRINEGQPIYLRALKNYSYYARGIDQCSTKISGKK